MSDEAAFLRAICEHPDEDTPRLVFADWLDEQGDDANAAWAELIRVQVPLARGPGAEREKLVARERELLPTVVNTWFTRLKVSADLKWANWTRGFPLTLDGAGSVIRIARPAFAERVPLREFNINAATDADLIEFATWPELQLVRKLGVWTESYLTVAESGLVALFRCPHLRNLERLRIHRAAYTDAAMEALLEAPYLDQLINVKIVGRGFGELSSDVQELIRRRFGRHDIY